MDQLAAGGAAELGITEGSVRYHEQKGTLKPVEEWMLLPDHGRLKKVRLHSRAKVTTFKEERGEHPKIRRGHPEDEIFKFPDGSVKRTARAMGDKWPEFKDEWKPIDAWRRDDVLCPVFEDGKLPAITKRVIIRGLVRDVYLYDDEDSTKCLTLLRPTAPVNGDGHATKVQGAHPKSDKSGPATPTDQFKEKMEWVLVAMLELNAVDADHRRDQTTIIDRAEPGCRKPKSYKVMFAKMRSMGLIDRERGRNGGTWLTPEGRALAVEKR